MSSKTKKTNSKNTKKKENPIKPIYPLIVSLLVLFVFLISFCLFLAWGENFLERRSSNGVAVYAPSDKQDYFKFIKSTNGLFYFKYEPPYTYTDLNFSITHYSIEGYNDYKPLQEPYFVNKKGDHVIFLGVLNDEPINLGLKLDDETYIIFNQINQINNFD